MSGCQAVLQQVSQRFQMISLELTSGKRWQFANWKDPAIFHREIHRNPLFLWLLELIRTVTESVRQTSIHVLRFAMFMTRGFRKNATSPVVFRGCLPMTRHRSWKRCSKRPGGDGKILGMIIIHDFTMENHHFLICESSNYRAFSIAMLNLSFIKTGWSCALSGSCGILSNISD